MTSRKISRGFGVFAGALGLYLPACGGEVPGSGGLATETSTGGSPTSFTPTSLGEEQPTTTTAGVGSSSEAGASETGPGGTTGAGSCGNGVVEAGEGCDDGAENSVYAACTDECQANVCGDGKVHVGVEGCDEGPDNVDSGYCRSDCRLGVCGDGYLFAGVEACDSGVDNGPAYGGCDEKCTINRCGDGELDVPDEVCDEGEANGSGGSREGGMTGCGLDCGFMGRRLFLSSKLFSGDMGSRAGADVACRNMAEGAGFTHAEKFRAILGDSHGSLLAVLLGDDEGGLPIITPGGLIVADSVAALLELGPERGISNTETGEVLTDQKVWTNLGPSGAVYLEDLTQTCADWTSNDSGKSARIGLNAVAPEGFMQWRDERRWLSFDSRNCKVSYSIYCVELD